MTFPVRPRPSNRGFTLIELMAVVVITAILALAGVALFRKQVSASKGGEAVSVIQAIRSAQESYFAENHVYLNVSTTAGGQSWYPNLTLDTKRYAWVQDGHPDYQRWRALAPSINRPVLFGYLVNAGLSGDPMPDAIPLALRSGSPLVNGWYTIQARGDANGNKLYAQYAASSVNSEIVIDNEGE